MTVTASSKPAAMTARGAKRGVLETVFRELHLAAPAPVPVIALEKGAPFGGLDIKADGCTLCHSCVAACPNASASLFTGAKITHLGLLPQGQPERDKRALAMVEQMDLEGFGHCTLAGECQEACPKEISIDVIKRMNRDYALAAARYVEERRRALPTGGGDRSWG